jgi:hypothetical protein
MGEIVRRSYLPSSYVLSHSVITLLLPLQHYPMVKVKVKVKLFLYRPGQALRVPEG